MKLTIRVLLLMVCVSVFAPALFAQADFPWFTIYVAAIKGTAQHLTVGAPFKITQWKGYNNQPSFTADGRSVWYTSRRDSQTDIYRYDIGSQATLQITKTPESEYSPQTEPSSAFFSVVRVEADSTQRIWSFGYDGSKPALVAPDQKGVGYYCWIDEGRIAAFVLGKNDSDTLKVIGVRGEQLNLVIATNVGRCLQRVPIKGGLAYVQKKDDTTSFVEVYDFQSKKSFQLLKTLPGSEDFVWTKTDDIIMGSGSKLYISHPPDETTWTEFADFSAQGVKSITRLTLSPAGDEIAVVAKADPNRSDLSPLWAVHIDEVEQPNRAVFERLCLEQASKRSGIFQRFRFAAKPYYELATEDGAYYSLRPKSDYAELDHSVTYPDNLKKALTSEVYPLDDSIHPTLRYHHNELWSYDVDGSFVPADANQHALLLEHFRLHTDMVKPGMGDAYDSAITMMRKTFIAANVPEMFLAFHSSYGSGANMYFWFGKSKDECDPASIEKWLQNNAAALQQYRAAKELLAKCVVSSTDSYGVVRRDLSALDPLASFLGF